LGRGEVGMVNAVNNAGKTTLLRNLMVSLCTGRAYAPLGNFSLPKRVAFLDFEDTLTFLRQDLRVMLAACSGSEQARFSDNALLVCEARLDDEDLSLSKQYHFFTVTERLHGFAPDLIIVDTIASAFQIRNENDNAEVRAFITRPLKQLAKDCNAALLAAHHIGKAKAEEGQTREASHKGRGASSFADMARLVLNLEKDNINDTVILSCAKVKGQKFADTILRLNLATRWFASQGRQITNLCWISSTMAKSIRPKIPWPNLKARFPTGL
jgi:RecA-family ATPase